MQLLYIGSLLKKYTAYVRNRPFSKNFSKNDIIFYDVIRLLCCGIWFVIDNFVSQNSNFMFLKISDIWKLPWQQVVFYHFSLYKSQIFEQLMNFSWCFSITYALLKQTVSFNGIIFVKIWFFEFLLKFFLGRPHSSLP